MSSTLTIPQHDRRPYPRSIITDAAGAAVDLGSDTIYWLMRPVGNTTDVLRVAAYVITAGAGLVEYRPATTGAPSAWGSVHHTGNVGSYDQQWERMNGSSEPWTSPTVLYNTVVIPDDLDVP